MSRWSLGHRPRTMQAVALAITIGAIGSLVWAAILGDGHGPVPRTPYRYGAIEVCPSGEPWLAALDAAAIEYDQAGVEAGAIELGPCSGPPSPGVAQVRSAYDLVSTHPAPVDGEYVDRIAHHSDGSAVAYIDGYRARPCTPAHVLGHLSGLGHSTRRSSVMYPLCGRSFEDIGRRE